LAEKLDWKGLKVCQRNSVMSRSVSSVNKYWKSCKLETRKVEYCSCHWLYSGWTQFKSQGGYYTSYVVLLQYCQSLQTKCWNFHKIGHKCFIPHSCLFTTHNKFYNSLDNTTSADETALLHDLRHYNA